MSELLSKSNASISSFGKPNSESIAFAFSMETGSFSFNSILTGFWVSGLYSILISGLAGSDDHSLYFFIYSCCNRVFSSPFGSFFISSRIATKSFLELAVDNLSVMLNCSLLVLLVIASLISFPFPSILTTVPSSLTLTLLPLASILTLSLPKSFCPALPVAFIPPPIRGDIIAPPTKPSTAELPISSKLPPSYAVLNALSTAPPTAPSVAISAPVANARFAIFPPTYSYPVGFVKAVFIVCFTPPFTVSSATSLPTCFTA